jgi:hypothetical protein
LLSLFGDQRACEQLFDELTSELAWRKKELVFLRALVEQHGDSSPIARAGIVLLYAHLNGAIKACITLYLKFLDHRLAGSRLSDLAPGIAGLALCTQFANRLPEKPHEVRALEYWRLFAEMADWDPNQPIKGVHMTRMFNTLRMGEGDLRLVARQIGIANIQGWDGEPLDDYIQRKWKVIDERLIRERHRIAHGGDDQISVDHYSDAERIVLELVDRFVMAIVEAARKELYLSGAKI